MSAGTERFTHTHCVDDVLKGQIAPDLPVELEKIDLRFLIRISLADTYNGAGDPVNGTKYVAILYGNQIAWYASEWIDEGTTVHRQHSGYPLYRELYFAAQLYFKIQAIGFELFQGSQLKRSSRVVYINKNDLDLVSAHPLWKEMTDDFGLELRRLKRKPSGYFVTVSKHYDPEIHRR